MSLMSNVKAMHTGSAPPHQAGYRVKSRHGVLSLFQLFLAWTFQLTIAYARPVLDSASVFDGLFTESEPMSPKDPGLWIYLGTALTLVLVGGAFAGLTIALMGQDEVYLQVISASGEGAEKKNATKVLKLLKKGKHWVLVTLLIGNVITNETLPIVLDRSIGGGLPAAVTSTILVIIFGEILPQSVCVRFGLPIGAWMSPVVLILMWIFAPITWPIAKLLDYLLGEDHGTTYKKAGLKTLVTLHKTMGTAPGERLNEDEVTIISAVLDLKAKTIGSIMTPMDDVFTLSADAVLDEELIDKIMHEGYSRIPVHEPKNDNNFVGMLLVKMLITYDPEDCSRVTDFELAALPETRPDTSCLDIINFFQQGKSHMVLISDDPGKPWGALGVVTLEDVIEELIGEEIIDESDVFIDVHKAIRRIQPAPSHRFYGRVPKGEVVLDGANSRATAEERLIDVDGQVIENGDAEIWGSPSQKRISSASLDFPRISMGRTHTFTMRRASSAGSKEEIRTVQMRPYTTEMKERLRNLGPSNAASRPRQSRINTVKVKPGIGAAQENNDRSARNSISEAPRGQITSKTALNAAAAGPEFVSPGHSAKDGVQAMQAGYGTLDRSDSALANRSQSSTKSKGIQADRGATRTNSNSRKNVERSRSHSTLGEMYNSDQGESRHSSRPKGRSNTPARSGSITENVVDSGGVKKLVLEMTSSSEDAEEAVLDSSQPASRVPSQPTSRPTSHRRDRSNAAGAGDDNTTDGGEDGHANGKKKKKQRRSRKKKTSSKDGTHDENRPLIGQ